MKIFLAAVLAGVAGAAFSATAAHAAYLSLGTANTSNAQTSLSGTTSTSELRVSNASTATGALSLYGLIASTTPGVNSAAVRGQNNGTGAYGYGVWGSQAGSGPGVYGTSLKGPGIYGRHNSTLGTAPGVRGDSVSGDYGATAVYGVLTATSGGINSAAVRGENKSTSSQGAGVFGSQAGEGIGVWGQSPKGWGVIGQTGSGTGVSGVSLNSIGVFGRHSSTQYRDPGVWGISDSADPEARGVEGETTATTQGQDAAGVYGLNDATNRTDVYGVRGIGPTGVRGTSSMATGYGVWGESDNNQGTGVFGYSTNATGNGVIGIANNGTDAYGVYGASTNGYAGYFDGKVKVAGDLYVTGTIHNPAAAPGHAKLGDASVASGNARTDARGFATARLPQGFQSAGRSFRYQLTIVGTRGWNARVAKPVNRDRFVIQTDKPHVEVSWQVTAAMRAQTGREPRSKGIVR